MSGRRADIEAFVRGIVREVERAEADGVTTPEALADRFNAKGLTTRKGRGWTAETMRKFLASRGARRFRSLSAGAVASADKPRRSGKS